MMKIRKTLTDTIQYELLTEAWARYLPLCIISIYDHMALNYSTHVPRHAIQFERVYDLQSKRYLGPRTSTESILYYHGISSRQRGFLWSGFVRRRIRLGVTILHNDCTGDNQRECDAYFTHTLYVITISIFSYMIYGERIHINTWIRGIYLCCTLSRRVTFFYPISKSTHYCSGCYDYISCFLEPAN